MHRNQQLESLLPNSWIVSDDTSEMDEDALHCTEGVCSSPIRTFVISSIFIIAIGASHPTSNTVILGTQLPITLGEIGSYQGGIQERTYINIVVPHGAGSNKYVAYSVPETYNEDRNGVGEEAIVEHKNHIVLAIVYGFLGIAGVIITASAVISSFIFPLYDRGMAIILLPLSLAFLFMIGIRYYFRREHNAGISDGTAGRRCEPLGRWH